MTLQKLPVTSLNDEQMRRRHREVTNLVLTHQHDDSRVMTQAEKAAGVAVVNYAYPPGNARRYGAKGDGVTDDTVALQNWLNVLAQGFLNAGGSEGYLPAGSSFYHTTGPLFILADGVRIFGDGAGSVIFNSGTGNTLEIGDGTPAVSNVCLYGLNFTNSVTGAACIVADWATNLIIDSCLFSHGDPNSGNGLECYDVFCARIVNNTFGSIPDYGIYMVGNINACQITGNRLDGRAITSTCGIYMESGSQNQVTGNTIETWNVCVQCVGMRACVFYNYMETYEYGYQFVTGLSYDMRVGGHFAATDATVSIFCDTISGISIDDVHCEGTHSVGAPIQATTNAGPIWIYPNITHDDVFVVDWPINHLALGQHLLSDNLYPAVRAYVSTVTHTGTTGETTLKSWTGIRQHIGTGTEIYVRAMGRCVNTNGQKDVRLKLAGTTIATVTEAAGSTDDWIIEAWIHIESATVAAGGVRLKHGSTSTFDYLQSGVAIALSTTDPVIIVTGQLANSADTITVNQFKVQVIN